MRSFAPLKRIFTGFVGLFFALGFWSELAASVTAFEIVPQSTDPKIGAEFNSPHVIYVDREIVLEQERKSSIDRHQVLLFLPGTNGKADGAKAFCELAAELGYHVINLEYPDSIAATICGGDSDRNAYEKFRLSIIAGGASRHISIEKADSIENRLTKLLVALKTRRPEENWGQFLADDGAPRWSTIAVAGQSQGGGHAALIGIKHRVARVICTGAPKDYSKRLDAPAAWYSDPSETPKACFFTFNHRQDVVGCTPQQLMKNFAALQLSALGPPVDAATTEPPYHHTRVLLSSFPEVTIEGLESKGAKSAHTSVIATKNASRWRQVWTYMLTEQVPEKKG